VGLKDAHVNKGASTQNRGHTTPPKKVSWVASIGEKESRVSPEKIGENACTIVGGQTQGPDQPKKGQGVQNTKSLR